MAQGSPPDNIIGQGRFPPGSGGSGPNEPTVEARIARLEVAVEEIKKELQAVRLDLAEIKGRLSNIPTGAHLVFMQGGLILAIFAAAFALLRYAPPH
jgi:hypothetical protein